MVDNLNEKFLEGAKIRSKATYIENNERPTRFFLKKEKKLANDKHIKILKTDKGEVVTSIDGIKEECSNFYDILYSKKCIDNSLDDYFLHDIPKLSEDSCDECEGVITIDECRQAIKLMENYKSPGPDGLPKEFYSFAFPFIGQSFVKLINRFWLEGTLPLSQSRSNGQPLSGSDALPYILQRYRKI